MLTRRELGTAAALLASPATPQNPPAPPLYFDLHIDTPSRMVSESLNLAESLPYTCVDIPKMKQGGLHAGFFAVFAPARSMTPVEAVKQALKIIDVVVEEVKRHPSDLFLATSSRDVLRAQRENKIGILLGVEGGHMIDSSLEVLRQFYRLGARYLGLTHSGNTPWVGAAEYADGPKGLTDFGRDVSPRDPSYNCVAFAVGDTAHFWYDVAVKGYYWPPGTPSADTLDGWVKIFSDHGYQNCESDALEPDFEKIAIYANSSVPEHVARQKGSGWWISKMGKGHDIEHATLSELEGSIIGCVERIMKRTCQDGQRVLE